MSIKIHPCAVICTALLQLRNGHVEAARCTLAEAIHESVELGEEPDLTIMRAANYLDNGLHVEAKALLEASI